MKRHPHLQPLSDDHHAALVLARRVRRAAERRRDRGELAQIWEDASRRFSLELETHFRVEEEWLFPQLSAAGERALLERACADHARLRELIGAGPDPDVASEFAALLHRHVRFEERELFVRAESVLTLPALAAVGRAALEARLSAAPQDRAVDAYVALGSNLGDREAQLARRSRRCARIPRSASRRSRRCTRRRPSGPRRRVPI